VSRFVDYIKIRLHRLNKNYLCAIVGATGSGKTYSALRLAEQVDENFTIAQVVFTPQEFMDLLNSGSLKRGSAIVFDEAGVAANSRNFQTATNKCLHFITQTFRSQNYCVIYTCPDFAFLDLGIRKLVHALLETKRIDYASECVIVKPLQVENNPQTGKVYLKYPRYRKTGSKREMVVITKLRIHKPSETLIEAYEHRKFAYNKKLQADVQTTFNSKGTVRAAKPDLQAILKVVNSNKEKYITKRGALNRGLVAQEFGVGGEYLDRLRQLCKKNREGDNSTTVNQPPTNEVK